MIAPLGRTTLGITVWRGRTPGTHLAWGGPGDGVHLCEGSLRVGGELFLGRQGGYVGPGGPRCETLAQAQRVADRFLASADSLAQFYADDPRRKWSRECDYGVMWCYRELNHPLWRVSYVRETGEVYAVALPNGQVLVLGTVPADEEPGRYYRTLDQVLAGWAESPEARDLFWVIGRLEAHAEETGGQQ